MGVNFGKTAKGAGSTSGYTDANACKFTSDEATSVCAIAVYLEYVAGDAKTKCAIYDASFNLVSNATTDEVTITSGQDGWVSLKFSTKPSVSASTVYWLAWCHDVNTKHYHDAGGTNQRGRNSGVSYGSLWPASITFDFFDDLDYSIYALGIPVPSVSDTVTVAENVTMFTNKLYLSVFDTVTVSEWTRMKLLSIAVNDSVTVGEGITVSMPCINVQEWVNVALVSRINVNDNISVNEDITPLVPFYHVSVNDSTSLTESITTLIPFYLVSVNDSATITEAITAFISTYFVSVNDAASLAEALSFTGTLANLSVFDLISLFDKPYLDLWVQRTKETDAWTERTKETDAWTERTKETDAWTERASKEAA